MWTTLNSHGRSSKEETSGGPATLATKGWNSSSDRRGNTAVRPREPHGALGLRVRTEGSPARAQTVKPDAKDEEPVELATKTSVALWKRSLTDEPPAGEQAESKPEMKLHA